MRNPKNARMLLAVLVSLGLVSYATAGATVYVVHGIPGQDLGADPALPVDVSINGACALPGFAFGEIVGPLALDAGTYDIAISLADPNNPCGNAPVIEAPGIELVDGENYSIVAHLTADGTPTASVFVNDLSVRHFTSRVNVFHTAAAPAVNIELDREHPWWWPSKWLWDVMNGDQGSVELIYGTYDVSIFPAESWEPVFGPLAVDFERETAYAVFAVGSLANETFTLLAQPIENAAPQTAEVYVVHGIPGEDLGADPALPVDVSLNGACALPGFTFGEIVGPLTLDAGSYDIAIGLADPNNPCGNAPVIEAPGVELAGGQSYSIVAHLTEDGAPTASVFVNDLETSKFKATVNVFHTAAAPAVDITLERDRPWWYPTRWIGGVANGDAASTQVLYGNWGVTLFPAGAEEPVFGPVPVALQRSTAYFVYAVGSLTNETFTLLVAEAAGGSTPSAGAVPGLGIVTAP